MGQAKLRGSREQRVAEGIAKREAVEAEAKRKAEERRILIAKKEMEMSPEERERRSKARAKLNGFLAYAAGYTGVALGAGLVDTRTLRAGGYGRTQRRSKKG